jgi:hypothetical protein
MGQPHLSHECEYLTFLVLFPLLGFSASQHRSDTTPEVNIRQMEKAGCQYAARHARGVRVALASKLLAPALQSVVPRSEP